MTKGFKTPVFPAFYTLEGLANNCRGGLAEMCRHR